MGQGERVPRNIVAYLDDEETRYYAFWRGDSTLVERVDDGTLSPPETIGSVLPGTRGSYALLSDTVRHCRLRPWDVSMGIDGYVFREHSFA